MHPGSFKMPADYDPDGFPVMGTDWGLINLSGYMIDSMADDIAAALPLIKPNILLVLNLGLLGCEKPAAERYCRAVREALDSGRNIVTNLLFACGDAAIAAHATPLVYASWLSTYPDDMPPLECRPTSGSPHATAFLALRDLQACQQATRSQQQP